MENSICCEPQVDTFLAHTEVRLGEHKEFKATQKEIEDLQSKLLKCITDYKSDGTPFSM